MKYVTTEGEVMTSPIHFKTPFNHDVKAEARASETICPEPTLTQQHGKEEADINVIVSRFMKTGVLPQIQIPPLAEDFEDVFDLQSALNQVNAAKHSFMQLDPEVRDAFRNDPARFVAQVDNWLGETDPKRKEENLQVMRSLRLAVPQGRPADPTTLGDVLAAIKEQGTPKEPKTPNP